MPLQIDPKHIKSEMATDAELAAGLSGKAPIASPTFTGTVTIPYLVVNETLQIGVTGRADSLNSLLPDQTGNSGKFLYTNGSDASWEPATGGSSVEVPVGSIIAYHPGYYVNGTNGTFTLVGPSTNDAAGINSYLPAAWRVCNGAELNDSGSPIFNGAGRYLPNLTDSRFIMGSTSSGSVGGANSVTLATGNLPTHSHPSGTYAVNTANAPHNHPASSNTVTAPHAHPASSPASTTVNNANAPHSHGFGGGGFIAVGSGPVQTVGNGGTLVGGTIHTASLSSSVNTAASLHSHPASTSVSTTVNSADAPHSHTITNVADNAPHSHPFSGTSGDAGSGSSFSIIPQYLATVYIMRVK